ncbi:hypothetical protein [Sinorhizobium sp. BG8]|uniref:hypothetical protein n=1 Tax=Sinorhizobium sp. BG8 TaxID=2613773 RepID=UPI00193EBF4C|nr:hypothetical protein [Sinorhizobium sp. BG8]QRM54600.1 hypothetical protein F3Y30_08615 [Sinorhizobium sp. BG8]
MTITIDTLGKAARHRMLVVATCRRCERQAKFMASDLAGMYGAGRDPRELPFKCRECGVRDSKVTVIEFPFDRKPDTVIWRPVKGGGV